MTIKIAASKKLHNRIDLRVPKLLIQCRIEYCHDNSICEALCTAFSDSLSLHLWTQQTVNLRPLCPFCFQVCFKLQAMDVHDFLWRMEDQHFPTLSKHYIQKNQPNSPHTKFPPGYPLHLSQQKGWEPLVVRCVETAPPEATSKPPIC